MDQEQQIKQEPFGLSDDLFEFSDDFRPNIRDLFDFRGEVFIQEYPELIIQSLDMNHSSYGDTILETEVESMSSSTINDEVPILEGEEALCSVNRYDCNQEPNNKNSKNDNSRGKSQANRKDLLMDLKTYSKPHTCNPCGLSYTYKNVLLKHARLHHNHDGINIVCTKQPSSNNYQDELTILTNPNKLNKDNINYSCDLCKAIFNRFDIYKRHRRLHINQKLAENIEEETYRCIDNGMLFKSLSKLKLHTEQNTIGISQNSSTLKIFPCDSCDKVYKNKSSQKLQLRFHAGGRPFNCRYCDKSFADRSTRKKHERIHTGKRPYVCAVCEKAFNQRAALRRHIQFTHAGCNKKSDIVEEYKCMICVFFCQSSTDFYLHLLQHSDENTAKSRVGTSKQQSFVLKDGECTRTCPTVHYFQ